MDLSTAKYIELFINTCITGLYTCNYMVQGVKVIYLPHMLHNLVRLGKSLNQASPSELQEKE